MESAWYAIRVRSNHESTAAEYLKATGHEVFFPAYRDRKQWSDRVKIVEVPLFTGYLFCRMNINRRQSVVKAPGVVSIVGFGKNFIAVPDEEIAAVKQVISSDLFTRPCPYLNVGDRVRVMNGPLTGVEGILLDRRDETRLIVSVYLLQRSISTEIDLGWVRPLGTSVPALRVSRPQTAA